MMSPLMAFLVEVLGSEFAAALLIAGGAGVIVALIGYAMYRLLTADGVTW